MKRNRKLVTVATAFFTLAAVGCGSQTFPTSPERTVSADSRVTTPADGEIARAKELVERRPDLSSSHLRLAAAYVSKVRESGNYAFNRDAESSIAKALNIDPKSFTAQVLSIAILLSEHEFEEALSLSDRLLGDRFDNPALLAARTDALTELGRFPEAIEAAQRFVNTRPNAASYTRVAHLRSLHGDTEGAIQARHLAVRSADPASTESYAWYVTRLGNEYLLAGKRKEAGQAFDRALEIFPDYHWALEGKGKLLAKQGRLQEAAALYERLLENSDEPGRAIFLGDIYVRLGRTENAQETYREAIRIERAKQEPDLHRIALHWADAGSNLDEALTIAREDSEVNDDLAASDTYAWTLFKTGDPVSAKRVMTRAMRTGIKDALFFYHLGMIEMALGNENTAERLLDGALAIDPEFDLLQSAKAREALARLRGEG